MYNFCLVYVLNINSEVTHLSNYFNKSIEIPIVMVSEVGLYSIFFFKILLNYSEILFK